MIDDGKSDVSALTTKTNKTASGALKRHCKLCGKLVANWWKHKKDVHNGLEVPFLSCAINCSICQGKSTPWVGKPTPGWANLLPVGKPTPGGQTYSRVGKPTPWVGKPTPWVGKPTPEWANLLPSGQTYSLGGQSSPLGFDYFLDNNSFSRS